MIEINQVNNNNENNTVVNLGDLSHQKTDKIIPQSLDRIDETIPKYLPIRSSETSPNIFNISGKLKAYQDELLVKKNDSLTGNVLTNDDLLSNKATVVLGQKPQNGTLNLDKKGNFSYIPNANFSGVDSFSYSVFDNKGWSKNSWEKSETTLVSITVSPINNNPDKTPILKEYDTKTGYGLIDASAMVSKAINEQKFNDVPNLGGTNWNLDMINAPEVWNQGYTGKGVVVAVIDTGVRINEPEINIWTNTDEIEGNGIDDDNNGYIDDINGWDMFQYDNEIKSGDHGTHVAGIIGAKNNGFKSTGVAPDAVIMPLQVFGDKGGGNLNSITEAIYYAVDNGAKVINMSLSGWWPYLKDAMIYAESKGVSVVSAAGNYYESNPSYPAAYATEVGIAVGAVNNTGILSNFSNRSGSDSNMLYVTAPGQGVLSITGTKSGTSMSAPHVAGVIALMLEANPNLTVNEIKSILKEV